MEEKLKQVQDSISKKLENDFGYILQDDTLSVWIIQVAIRDNKAKSQVVEELKEFIEANSSQFTDWLWEETPKLLPMLLPKEPEKPIVKAPTKPKLSTKPKVEKKTQQTEGPRKNFQKAINDTKNEGVKRQRVAEEGSNSYVTTGKDGRKIIQKPNAKNSSRGYRKDKPRRDEKASKSSTDNSSKGKQKKGEISFLK